MERYRVPAWLRLIGVLAAAVLLSTWLDPYLQLGSPLAAQAVNAVVPLMLVLLVWALAGRAWLALLAEVILLLVLGHAERMKVLYLDTDLVYADLTVVGSLLKDPQLVLGFVRPSATTLALGAAALAGVLAIGWCLRRRRRASPVFRVGCLLACLLAAGVVWSHRAPDVMPSLQWEVFQQMTGAQRVGVAGNLLLGRMTTRKVQRSPDPGLVQAFWREPLVIKAAQQVAKAGDGRRPDIVVVQSESLFEPSQLCGFADQPVLQRISGDAPAQAGSLQVPVFGGRTLQTEFEVLSGAPIAFYPGSMFAYYELVDHDIDALPRVMRGMGYKTVFIHPNDRGFWRRGAAMPDMGFETFQDIGSFISPRDYSDRGRVSDVALTRMVLAELDSASRPTFVTAVTMDNHGPWGDFVPPDQAALGLPARLTGEGRTQMADYVARVIDADKAYGFLIDALQRRGRPTIVVIYGDHLPALPAVYNQLCFKDGKSPQKHFPPYRVWANFPLPPVPDRTTSYLLQGWLLHAAGLPLRDHVLANALAGLAVRDPAATPADRQRILGEYANIAAANVGDRAAPPDLAGQVFLDRERALDVLLKRLSRRDVGAGSLRRQGDLYLPPRKDASAELDFDTRAAVASLTLRPYMGAPLVECLGTDTTDTTDAATITVKGDGDVLYRAAVMSSAARLTTLDLRGVRQLTVRVDQAATADICGQVQIRVAQMLCYSAQCDRPGPGRPATAQPRKPPRILAADPVAGDIAALDTVVSEQRRQINRRMRNLRWLISHETARQQGFAPFEVRPDAQLFMHPAAERHAWIDVDVRGIATLELTPHINALDDQCKAMNAPGQEAGVVGLTVSVDGTPVLPRFLLDRNYQGTVPVAIDGGRTLRIEVDKGNAVAWCDWFSVGVDALQRAPTPAAAAVR